MVQAPLLRVEDGDEPDIADEPGRSGGAEVDERVAETAPDAVAEPPVAEAVAEPDWGAVAESGPGPEPPVAEPEPVVVVAPVADAAVPAAPERATRYCGMCGDRVPIDADGLHCYLGHTLSPAHAVPPPRRGLRRWFGGRG